VCIHCASIGSDTSQHRPAWPSADTGAVAFASTGLEQRDFLHENSPCSSCSRFAVCLCRLSPPIRRDRLGPPLIPAGTCASTSHIATSRSCSPSAASRSTTSAPTAGCSASRRCWQGPNSALASFSIHKARLSADHPNHHPSRENLAEVCVALGTAVVKCEWAADGQQSSLLEVLPERRESRSLGKAVVQVEPGLSRGVCCSARWVTESWARKRAAGSRGSALTGDWGSRLLGGLRVEG
jgi:hypothetical protein